MMYLNYDEENQASGQIFTAGARCSTVCLYKKAVWLSNCGNYRINYWGRNSLACTMHGIRMGDYTGTAQLLNLWIFEFRLLVHIHSFRSTSFSSFKTRITFCQVIFFVFNNILLLWKWQGDEFFQVLLFYSLFPTKNVSLLDLDAKKYK